MKYKAVVKRDGEVRRESPDLFSERQKAQNWAEGRLLEIQPNSMFWAQRYEGWSIEIREVHDEA